MNEKVEFLVTVLCCYGFCFFLGYWMGKKQAREIREAKEKSNAS